MRGDHETYETDTEMGAKSAQTAHCAWSHMHRHTLHGSLVVVQSVGDGVRGTDIAVAANGCVGGKQTIKRRAGSRAFDALM